MTEPDRPLFSNLLERALRTAARWHRGHLRKASDLPYLTHLAGVALILARAGFDDEELLAAALLHDVVEDTGCTLQELCGAFPPRVVEYVEALSEQKRADGRTRSWEDRKRDHLQHVAAAPVQARALILADKLHNLGTMLVDLDASDGGFWERFNAPPERIVWYHRAMIEKASQDDPRLQRLAEECRALLERLEAAAEEAPGDDPR